MPPLSTNSQLPTSPDSVDIPPSDVYMNLGPEMAELICVIVTEINVLSLFYIYVILQPFRRFTYITAHPPTLPLLHLRQFILQPFFRFSYVTSSSLNSPGEPPMPLSIHQTIQPYELTNLKMLIKSVALLLQRANTD